MKEFESFQKGRNLSFGQFGIVEHFFSNVSHIVFSEIAHLEIALERELANHPAFEPYDGTVTDAAFPELLEAIRLEAREEFGALADRPTENP